MPLPRGLAVPAPISKRKRHSPRGGAEAEPSRTFIAFLLAVIRGEAITGEEDEGTTEPRPSHDGHDQRDFRGNILLLRWRGTALPRVAPSRPPGPRGPANTTHTHTHDDRCATNEIACNHIKSQWRGQPGSRFALLRKSRPHFPGWFG